MHHPRIWALAAVYMFLHFFVATTLCCTISFHSDCPSQDNYIQETVEEGYSLMPCMFIKAKSQAFIELAIFVIAMLALFGSEHIPAQCWHESQHFTKYMRLWCRPPDSPTTQADHVFIMAQSWQKKKATVEFGSPFAEEKKI